MPKDIKLKESFTITPEVSERLAAHSSSDNLSKSEIVDFAIRVLYNMDLSRCKPILEQYYNLLHNTQEVFIHKPKK